MTGESADAVAGLDWRAGLERYRGAYSDGSLHQCRLEFERFVRFCAREGLRPVPASPETVARAVDVYFRTCTAGTVEARVWRIRMVHRALQLPDPTRSEPVRLALRRGARTYGSRTQARQAAPVNAPLFARLCAACPDTLAGWRDLALLHLGYDTLCRQSELVSLRAEDLEDLPDGSARLRVWASKTDPFGRGDFVYLSSRGLAVVRGWLARSRIASGFILRSVHSETRVSERRLYPAIVGERLNALAAAAGVTIDGGRRLSGHSLRVGAAQDLALMGRTLPQIMRAGRWRNLDSVARYVQQAPVNVWRDGAGSVSGLSEVLNGAEPVAGERVGVS